MMQFGDVNIVFFFHFHLNYTYMVCVHNYLEVDLCEPGHESVLYS